MEFPSFSVAILTVLLALVLSTGIALTYKFTFQKEHFPAKLFQTLVFSSTAAAIVMMLFSDNVVVGFAVLGAVLIIRYRALFRYPRNIIFIFASLSIGIATGKFSYAIAISGTTIFCYIMFLLYYTPFESGQKK
ncbi:MAG: hypothetical protein GY744_18880 [Gammaproteobacteria bacterium]|nr:hypothetical protein [Gammaproteobacteria bacterium]